MVEQEISLHQFAQLHPIESIVQGLALDESTRQVHHQEMFAEP